MSKKTDFVTVEGKYPVKSLMVGEYVRKVTKTGVVQKRVFKLGAYCRQNKAYEIHPINDVYSTMYVKPGAMLHAGFDDF